jgi:hypothetical protein
MVIFDHQKFTQEIINRCSANKIDYIDAVVDWCDRNKVEIEYVASFIKKDPVFKSRLQEEAENLNILKKGARLPL